MEFDHIDPNTKHRVISRMVGEGISIKRIQEEIAKCEPVCANCHRLRERKRYEEGKLNNKRSVDPHALSDQARRRNSEKRAKRRANKKKYTDRRPPGPKPKEIVPSTLEACVERYDEDEEWRVNADLNSL
jgi:hypothetical protein